MASTFSVGDWLAGNPASACAAIHVSQPQQLGSWTKRARVTPGESTGDTAGGSGGTGTGTGSGGAGHAFYSFADTSGLLPFTPPSLPASLDSPYIRYIAKEVSENVGVETVVRAAASSSAAAAGGLAAALSGCDVLTFRNNLNKIYGTPFDPKASWVVDACLLPIPASCASASSSASSHGIGGSAAQVLFLDIVKEEQAVRGDPSDLERFSRWGYTFEALCTGQAVADATSEFGVLVRTRIASLRLFIGAEIDCFDPAHLPSQPGVPPKGSAPSAAAAGVCGGNGGSSSSAPLQQAQQAQRAGLEAFLELKTYRLPQHPGQQRTIWRHKHPKWWLQSFLAGVPRLALGGRDDQGMLHRIDVVATADLPRISAHNGAAWYPNQVLRFGTEVLGWMRQEAARQPGQHLRFTYAPGPAVADSGRGGASSNGSWRREGGGGRGWQGGRDGGSGGGTITCEVLQDGQLVQRIRRCLQECSVAS